MQEEGFSGLRLIIIEDYTPDVPFFHFKAGTEISIEKKAETMPEWYFCRDLQNQEAWIHHSFFIETEDSKAILVKNYHNFEFTVKKGEIYTAFEEHGDWYFSLNSEGEKGWIYKKQTKLLL